LCLYKTSVVFHYFCCFERLERTNFHRTLRLGFSGFGGLQVACWPLVPKFAGSHPAEAVGFLGRKNPQHAFLRRGSKAVGPMLACKKFLNVTWKSTFKQNSRTFLAHSSTFGRLVVKVGTSNPDGTISLKRLQCVVENKHTGRSSQLFDSKIHILKKY
jgi:hypothetical protein